MWHRVLVVGLAAGLAAGCATPRNPVRTIPSVRDYDRPGKSTIKEAESLVAEAKRAGAEQGAPYEYYSAEEYLRLARKQRARWDGAGAHDYAALAKDMAEKALREKTLAPSAATAAPLDNRAACQAEFDRLRTGYQGLDKTKAVEVGPALYARLTATLSEAEHCLNRRRGWRNAARALTAAAYDLEAISAQDTDKDGVPEIKDAAPQQPEDVDGFQDDDGAPDPDNDGDGVPDVVDREPFKPETRNNWHDEDGAPDDLPMLEPIYFAEASSALSADAKGYLRAVKVLLTQWPGLTLHIKGCARNGYSEQYNLELSRRRAMRVQQHLMDCGVPDRQLMVTFQGATEIVEEKNLGQEVPRDCVELILE